MNFIVKKRKPPVVPIISLIDILAILLIFFIATSTFKQPKLAVDIEPPLPGTLTTRPVNDVRTPLTISADNFIYLGADEEPIELGALAGRLAAARAAGTKIELKADEGADFGIIVKALDSLKKAGYKKGDYPTILKVKPGETREQTNPDSNVENP
ncbi:MAG: biopolymer transport protein ExbD [Pseudoalteromonas tetraodonis]|jgi:biopolymer transport protein ExbD